MSAPTHHPVRRPRAARGALLRPPARFAVLLLAVLTSLLGLAAPSPARADEQRPAVTVTLSTLTPASPTTSDTLTLSGTITNTSSEPISQVQVHLWRSTDALADASALDEALASSPENPLGRRMVSFDDGNVFDVTDVAGHHNQTRSSPRATFGPGESATFTVRGKVSGAGSLDFQAGGTYLVGVQVRGIPAGGSNQTMGRARALVVVSAPAAKTPAAKTPAPVAADRTTAATAVLLNSRPSLVQAGVLADDHLAGELKGRLARLVGLAEQPGSTLLVDPLLVDELTTMSKGYRLLGGADAAATRSGQQAATAMLARLAPLLSSGRACRTLYGSPDPALAVASGHGELLTRAAHPLPDGHPLAALPLAVVPAQGRLDERAVNAVASLHPSIVLATNLATNSAVQTLDGLQLVNLVPDAFAGGPGPDPRSTAAQQVGRLQAQQRLAQNPVTTLVTTEREAQAELAPAPWRRRVPLAQLVGEHPSSPAILQPVDAPADAGAWGAQVAGLDDDLATWGELVSRPDDARELGDRLLPAVISTAWQQQRTAATSWSDRVRGQLGRAGHGDAVSLQVVGSFVTSSASQEIPVTISNRLAEPVRVRVLFDSENPQRIAVADSGVHTVGPGDQETVKVRVTARANGEVGVTARLATTTGRRIGTPRSLTITATQAGRVGWVIIIASGVVLMAGTAMRIRQVQRERASSVPIQSTADLAHGQRRGH